MKTPIVMRMILVDSGMGENTAVKMGEIENGNCMMKSMHNSLTISIMPKIPKDGCWDYRIIWPAARARLTISFNGLLDNRKKFLWRT